MASLISRARKTQGLTDRAPARLHWKNGQVHATDVPPLTSEAPQGSLADLPFDNATEAPSAVVLGRKVGAGTSAEVWQDITAADFAAEVTTLAKGLIASGINPGDRIAIMSRTRYEWCLLDFAGWAAGAQIVPIYPTASVEQAHWILSDSGARICVAESEDNAASVLQASVGLSEPFDIWRLDNDDLHNVAERAGETTDAQLAERRAALQPDDPATLIYTSGTTGRPKGCVLTHGNFLTEVDNVTGLLNPVFQAVSKEDPSTLLFLPLAHVLGRMLQVACIRSRIRVGHAPSLKPEELREDFVGFKPTFLLGVPYLFEKIYHTGRAQAEAMGRAASFDRAARIAENYASAVLDHMAGRGPGPGVKLRAAHALYDVLVYRRVRKALGDNVGYAMCGGSSLDPRMVLFFAGAGILIFEGYGLTETTAAATVNPPLKPKPGTVGLPVPGTSVQVADDGEVLLRGPIIFEQYHASNEKPPISSDGWFATGDVGHLDEDGYLVITGRKKEILVTNGGKNVSPAPLEDRLRSHPMISQCIVVGDQRPYVAALVTLDVETASRFVEKQPGGGEYRGPLDQHPALQTEIQSAVDEANESVSRAESIRRFHLISGDFTEENGLLTPSLKIRRKRVLEQHADDIEKLYPRRQEN